MSLFTSFDGPVTREGNIPWICNRIVQFFKVFFRELFAINFNSKNISNFNGSVVFISRCMLWFERCWFRKQTSSPFPIDDIKMKISYLDNCAADFCFIVHTWNWDVLRIYNMHGFTIQQKVFRGFIMQRLTLTHVMITGQIGTCKCTADGRECFQ